MKKSCLNIPKYIAHRGCGVLAPENTLEAMKEGFEKFGYRAVEFDVMLSLDRIPFLMHDEYLGRTTPNCIHNGKVFSDVDSADLEKIDVGSWMDQKWSHCRIPRFTAILDYCIAHNIWMNIEIKPTPGLEYETGKVVAEIVKSYFPSSDSSNLPYFSSFSPESLRAALDISPHIPRGFLLKSLELTPDWRTIARDLKVESVNADNLFLTPDDINQIHAENYLSLCYTIDDANEAEQFFSQGVTSIFTNRLDIFPYQA